MYCYQHSDNRSKHASLCNVLSNNPRELQADSLSNFQEYSKCLRLLDSIEMSKHSTTIIGTYCIDYTIWVHFPVLFWVLHGKIYKNLFFCSVLNCETWILVYSSWISESNYKVKSIPVNNNRFFYLDAFRPIIRSHNQGFFFHSYLQVRHKNHEKIDCELTIELQWE